MDVQSAPARSFKSQFSRKQALGKEAALRIISKLRRWATAHVDPPSPRRLKRTLRTLATLMETHRFTFTDLRTSEKEFEKLHLQTLVRYC